MKRRSNYLLAGIIISVVIIMSVSMFEQFSNHEILLWNICEMRVLDGIKFFFYLNGTRVMLISLLALMVFFVSYIVYRKKDRRKKLNKITLLIVSAICIIVAGFSLFLYMMTEGDDRYYAYSSPNGKYSIIAREHSFLLAGGVDVYERTSPVTVRRIDVLGTDDGYRALSDSKPEIKWDENKVEFMINTGNGYTETVTLELEKK